MLTYDIVGMMGSFLISSALFPQIVKVYRTKSAQDLSLSFQILYVVGIIMVAVYGYGEMLWPIYVPCTIECVGAVVLLCMKVYFDHSQREQAIDKLSSMASINGNSNGNHTAASPTVRRSHISCPSPSTLPSNNQFVEVITPSDSTSQQLPAQERIASLYT